MLDHLGENVETAAQAAEARDAYLAAIEAIRQEPTLDIAISLKLTQLGLGSLDRGVPGERRADRGRRRRAGTFGDDRHGGARVRRRRRSRSLRARARALIRASGVALQSYLRRSATDVFDLPAGMRVRLVKGSYLEPPDVVFTRQAGGGRALPRGCSRRSSRAATRSTWPRTIRG